MRWIFWIAIIISIILGAKIVMGQTAIISKEYNEATKTYLLKDDLEKPVASIKLISEENVLVMRGQDRKVAEFKINNIDDYDDAFKGMEFYNLKTLQGFSRQFTYKYKIEKKDIIFDTVEECEWKEVDIKGNISKEKFNCVNKIHRYENDISTWHDFNSKAMLPKGNFTIGIFTDVYPDEKVEWVIDMYGQKLDKWAVWSEGLNSNGTGGNIYGYYKLDETSGTNALESVMKLDNLTLVNAMFNKSGIINWGVFFDGNGDYATTASLLGNAFTISVWFNNTVAITTASASTALMNFNDDDYEGIYFGSYTGSFANELVCLVGASYRNCWLNATAGATIPAGMHHMVWVRNATQYELYLDNYWKPVSITTSGVADTDVIELGCNKGHTGYWFGGLEDEVAFWNYSLSTSQISDLYNGGAGIQYDPNPDATPPNVTIDNPTNTTYSGATIFFNMTVRDVRAISSCWYSLNGGAFNYTLNNNSATNFYAQNSSMAYQGYKMNAYCNDSSNNMNNTESVSFNVAAILVPPVIKSLTPNMSLAVPYIQLGRHLVFP